MSGWSKIVKMAISRLSWDPNDIYNFLRQKNIDFGRKKILFFEFLKPQKLFVFDFLFTFFCFFFSSQDMKKLSSYWQYMREYWL
jgi:hypothetical protein